MTCGCSAIADVARTNAARCLTCPEYREGYWITAADLTVKGHQPAECLMGGAFQPDKPTTCPLGRHADAKGRVRSVGVLWRGCPPLTRWRLRRRLRAPLPGCGCVDRLKTIWEKVRG